jgi:hypothetical protein
MNHWDRRLLVVAVVIASAAGGALLADTGHASGGPARPTPMHQPAPRPAHPNEGGGARLV